MPVTLSSAGSLTLCLAMSNAFVFRAPKVSPPGWGGNKQVSAISPLKVDGRRRINSGALPRFGDNVNMEAGQRLPGKPSAACYRGWGSRAICPLHMISGVQDGNTTVPVGGEVGGVDRDDSGGVETASTTQGGEDGSTHGVSSDADLATNLDLANDADLQHNSLETMVDDTTIDEILPLELTPDYDVDEKNLIQEDSLDDVMGLVPPVVDYSGSTFDEDNPIDLVSNNALDEPNLSPFDPKTLYEETPLEGDARGSGDASTRQTVGVTDDDNDMLANMVQAIHDEIRSMLHSSDGNVLCSQWPLDLADVNGVVAEISLGPFGPFVSVKPYSSAHDEMTPVPMHGAADDDTTYKMTDVMSGGMESKAVILEEAINDVIRSVLNDAYDGVESNICILDDDMDELMWSKLHHAICGRAASGGANHEDAFDETLTSLLHNAFFGPAASKAVSALTKNACVSGLVVEDYVQVVYELYDKLEVVRCQKNNCSALDEEGHVELGLDDVFDELNLGPLQDLRPNEVATDADMKPVPNDSDASSAFDEDWLFDLADGDSVHIINLWSFSPAVSEDAAADEIPLVLREALFDGTGPKAVKGLVWSVLDDAFKMGVESEGLIVDDVVDELMWSKLHDVISVSGRAASGPDNLRDMFDDIATSLLHNAFFGTAASTAIEALTKYAGDRELVVETYVQAVSERYDEFKEVRRRSRNKNSDGSVGRKARKKRWTWIRKLWRKIRRNRA